MGKDQVEDIELLIRARYPIIYVVSWEEERVEEALLKIAERREKKLFMWTSTKGISLCSAGEKSDSQSVGSSTDPLEALDQVIKFVEPAIYLFKDLHFYLQDPAIIRKLRDVAFHLKKSYKTLVLLSPILRIPPEVEKDVTVFDFALPTFEDLGELLDKIIEDVKNNPKVKVKLDSADREKVLKAALGLTLKEAENVFAKALVKDGRLDGEDVSTILSEKQQIIRRSNEQSKIL